MWVRTESISLTAGVAPALLAPALAPGETVWHLAHGLGYDAMLADTELTWEGLARAANVVKGRAIEAAKRAKPAEVVGAAVAIGGLLLADGVLRKLGVDADLSDVGSADAQEFASTYLLALTPARLMLVEVARRVVARPFARPEYSARGKALQYWTPEVLARAPVRFEPEHPRPARRAKAARAGDAPGSTPERPGPPDAVRMILGVEPRLQGVRFAPDEDFPGNVEQALAIAARVDAAR